MCLSDGRSYWMKQCMDEQQRTRSECADAHANLEWPTSFPHPAKFTSNPGSESTFTNMPEFSGFLCERPHFSDILVYHIFFAQIFFEAAYPLGISWIDRDTCVTTSKKWVQKIKGQYMKRSTFWMIKYMNESVFSKARFMNGVGFEILARTSVPKLPLNYTPPPPPPHEIRSMAVQFSFQSFNATRLLSHIEAARF